MPPPGAAMADPADILITGAAGQVGLEFLAQAWPAHVRPMAPTLNIADVASVTTWSGSHPVAAPMDGNYGVVPRLQRDAVAKSLNRKTAP